MASCPDLGMASALSSPVTNLDLLHRTRQRMGSREDRPFLRAFDQLPCKATNHAATVTSA